MATQSINPPTHHPSLRVNDLLFINEYLANGRNGKQAYLTVHPGVKANSAEVGAARLLSQDKVKREIASRIASVGGATKAYIESSLLRYQAWADEKQDYLAGASICMDYAKLAGFIVEKHQEQAPEETVSEFERKLTARLDSPEALPGHADAA